MTKNEPTEAKIVVAGGAKSALRHRLAVDLRNALNVSSVEVVSRKELWPHRAHTRVVLIAWDREALASIQLYEIARLKDHFTLHVLASDVSIDELPLDVSPDAKLVLRADDESKLVGAVSGALNPPMFSRRFRYGESALASLSGRQSELTNDERRVLESAGGKLIYTIPARMFLREAEEIEVRVGHEQVRGLLSDISGRDAPTFEATGVVEVMGVGLRGDPREFSIEARSPYKQLVGGAKVEALGEGQVEFGQWFFHVTPLKTGRRPIHIEIAGEVDIGEGRQAMRRISPKDYVVEVRVSKKRLVGHLARAGLWLIALAFTSLVGAATQELWWPQIREFLGR